MEEIRGVLWLDGGPGAAARGEGRWRCVVLNPGEDGAWLDRAQSALWEMRKSCDWICVAAERIGAGVAAALAAQLPVERLALTGSRLYDRSGSRLRGQAARLERFARRNLALTVSEILLIGASDREIRGFTSLPGRGRLCAVDACGTDFLTAPWSRVCENNLLIPAKCV